MALRRPVRLILDNERGIPYQAAAEDLEAVATVTDDHTAVIEEVVADKGYHTVIRCSWIWRHSTRGPTSLNRTAADATERSRRRPATQGMRIAAAFGAGTAWLRCADGASTSNGRRSAHRAAFKAA